VSPADAVLLAVAALLGALARGIVSAYCTAPGGGPEGGTAASYCSTVGHGWSWAAFTAAAIAIGAVPLMLCRRWRFRHQGALALVVAALVANTAIVSSLPGYLGP
jgi:hypothetical protein